MHNMIVKRVLLQIQLAAESVLADQSFIFFFFAAVLFAFTLQLNSHVCFALSTLLKNLRSQVYALPPQVYLWSGVVHRLRYTRSLLNEISGGRGAP